MVAQQKILRVFRLVRALSNKPYKTIIQLAKLLDISKRSVERYFELLDELGYYVEKDFNDTFFIAYEQLPAEKGVSFTLEESELLQNLLDGLLHHPLRDGITRKLFVHSELRPLSQNLTLADNAKKIRQLVEAINRKQRVILHNYHSANTQSIADRKIEPLEFSDNYESITAYEPTSQLQKSYRIDRIAEVELLNELQTYKNTSVGTDLFGFIGNTTFVVKLRLSDLAYRRLIEEHPATKPHIQQTHPNTAHSYSFEGDVRSEVGIGRFILGLPGEIMVESPQKMKDYLNRRIKGLTF